MLAGKPLRKTVVLKRFLEVAMSINIPTHYVMQFSTNVNLLLQTKGSKLRGAVTSASYVGKQASPVDQVGAVAAQRVTTRFAPMGRVDAPTDRRWVFPVDYDLPQMIDSVRQAAPYHGSRVHLRHQRGLRAGPCDGRRNRAAFFGTAKTGEQGATSTTFPFTQVVGLNTGGTNSNLNVLEAPRSQAHPDGERSGLRRRASFCVVDSTNARRAAQRNPDHQFGFQRRRSPVLQEGKVTRFLGINFIHAERINRQTGTDDQTTSTTSKQIPVYAKSGMHLGLWQDIAASVSKRNDLQGEPMQAYVIRHLRCDPPEEKKRRQGLVQGVIAANRPL
jgi:hypothetical protein